MKNWLVYLFAILLGVLGSWTALSVADKLSLKPADICPQALAADFSRAEKACKPGEACGVNLDFGSAKWRCETAQKAQPQPATAPAPAAK
jgi:hypothetical protein